MMFPAMISPAMISPAMLLAAVALTTASVGAPLTAAEPTANPPVTDTARLQAAQHARVGLLADHAAVAPGQTLLAGLRIVHDAGWHT